MGRILVVDDTSAILELYHDLLTDEGYEVSLDTGPRLDLDQIAQRAPDLIILDYLFGQEAAGLVMVQQLAMHPATARIPIIVCTAAVQLIADVRPDLERLGIAVLPKPFAVDDLLALVAHALAPATAAQLGAAQERATVATS
jgi:CheY-like chemotaxis protein